MTTALLALAAVAVLVSNFRALTQGSRAAAYRGDSVTFGAYWNA